MQSNATQRPAKQATRRADCLSLWDQAVTLEMDRRIVQMCGCRAAYKAVVLRFDVVDARAERASAGRGATTRPASCCGGTHDARNAVANIAGGSHAMTSACVAAQRDTTSRMRGATGVQICGTGDLPERSWCSCPPRIHV